MPIALSRAAWVRCVPFALFTALLVLGRAAASNGAWGFDPQSVDAVGVLLASALLWVWRREYGELFAQTWPPMREVALAVMVGIALFGLWISLDAPWMRLGEATAGFRPVDAHGNVSWSLVALRWVGTALLVPVMEELFWRSFLMRWFQAPQFEAVDPGRVGLRAVVLSTFVFMLAHTLWLAAICAGLAFAWLYIRSGRLWSAVIAHAVTNGLLGVWVVFSGNWGYW
jgi:hypothetical protein